MLVVLTGVPGIGKSTTVKKAFEQSGAADITIVNYGDVMYKIAQEEELVEHRDDMRSLDTETQHRIQKQAALWIREMSDKEKIILDTHATIETPFGYIPGMPEWVLRELKPDCIVIIEAKAQDINAWRRKDLNANVRKREVDNLAGIDQHQRINQYAALSYSTLVGTPIKIIRKDEGMLEQAAQELNVILKHYG